MAKDAPRTVGSVSELPGDSQALVAEMLVNGATVEDTLEAVQELSGQRVPRHAIERFYHTRADLQERRVRNLLTESRRVKRVLREENSGDAEYAEAVVLTGLVNLRRAANTAQLAYVKAHQDHRERALGEEAAVLKNLLLEEKIHAEHKRVEALDLKVCEAREGLAKMGESATLDPETVRQIRQIYGLLEVPPEPADTGEGWEKG